MSGTEMTENIKNLINGKSVCIWGYGAEGKSTLKLIMSVGGFSDIAVLDQNPNIGKVIYENVEIKTLKDISCLDGYDVVFKSPGIVVSGKIKGIMTSQTEQFLKVYRDRTIGITGTKGKSTTTTLIYHILKSAGIGCVMGGNIGIPVFELLNDMKENTVAVLEMSCHQLEYCTVSPHRAVYLNLHEEHLDHYGSFEKYRAAKENIYLNQKEGDVLYCGEDVRPADYVGNIGNAPNAQNVHVIEKPVGNTICYKERKFDIPVDDIRLIGSHNYFNLAVAYAVCRDICDEAQNTEISDDVIISAVKTYSPLPHRLEYVGEYDGIKYYDDSISTIGDAAISAMESIKNLQTILIGGMDRGICYDELTEYLVNCSVKNIIFMYDTGKRIYGDIEKRGMQREGMILTGTLEEAVEVAKKVTDRGMACVMSPAAASYGYFKNFEERGERYAELIALPR